MYSDFIFVDLDDSEDESPVGSDDAAQFAGTSISKDDIPALCKEKLCFCPNLTDIQIEGIHWMLGCETKQFGGVLAHDPGLGKTLQCLCVDILTQDDNGPVAVKKPTLVICKKSLITVWCNEITKYMGKNVPFLCYNPDQRDWFSSRGHSYSKLTKELLQAQRFVIVHLDYIASFWGKLKKKIEREYRSSQDNATVMFSDIIIRSPVKAKKFSIEPSDVYNIPSLTKESPLFKLDWKRVYLDEAHEIRNTNTNKAKIVCNFRADYYWAITGTPIYNNNADIYNLLKFCRADMGEMTFKTFKNLTNNKAESIVYNGVTVNIQNFYDIYIQRISKEQITKSFIETLQILNNDMELDCIFPNETLLIEAMEGTPRMYYSEYYVNEKPLFYEICNFMEDRQMTKINETKENEVHVLVVEVFNYLRQFSAGTLPETFVKKSGSGSDLFARYFSESPAKFVAIRDYIDKKVGNDEKMLLFTEFIKCGQDLTEFLKKSGYRVLCIQDALFFFPVC